MRYRILGRTGLRVSEIGMGGVGAAGKYGPILNDRSDLNKLEPRLYKTVHMYAVEPREFARVMSCAAEAGINFLDTAPSYGESESVFGHYLKKHRDKWIVCTKIGTCGHWGSGELITRASILAQVSKSKKRLGVNYLDLLLIHSIDQYGRGQKAVDRVLVSGGMVDTMLELKKKGEVRYIGVSGFLPEVTLAAKTGIFDAVLTYNTFNLLVQDAREKLFPLCRKNNIGVILGGVFYQGLLTGNPELVLKRKKEFFEKEDPAFHRTEEMFRKIEKLMKYVKNKPEGLRKLALLFGLTNPAVSVVVTGMKSCQEVEENVRALEEGPLKDEEVKKILREVTVKPPADCL